MLIKIKKIFSKRGYKILYNMILGILGYILSVFSKKRDIWLIAERYNEARDNGYHLFKYIRNNSKDIEIYYIIDKNSEDYNKICGYGNIVQFESLKHHIFYWKAKMLISTHINGYIPNENAYKILGKVLKNNGKKIFLQHGITKDNLPQLFYDETKLDLFVCGAKPEYDFIKKNFGYNEGKVKYLGLCRYDNLIKYNTKQQILIMPTFRMEYYINKDSNITKEIEDRFINSEFYKNYYNLLNNQRLLQKMEKEKIEIIFYPHYEMQKFIYLFKDIPKTIRIANRNEYDIQTLLKESRLLITDYSSVFFDFAYMEKPIIYFQFDKEAYREKHYKEGYFSYEKNGFGPVEIDIDSVVNKIIEYVDNEYKIESTYLNRKRDFYIYNDENNCKRNFEAIKRIEG